MSESVSVTCPMCGMSMKLKDRSKLGKKASCPNCSNMFVLAESDPVDTERHRAAAPSLPPRRSSSKKSAKAGGKSKKSRQKQENGAKTGLIVGGGALVMLLFVGIGLWAAGLFSGDETPEPGPPVANGDNPAQPAQNKFDLSYLPPDAEMFLRWKLADSWKSPLLGRLAAQPQVQEALQELQQTVGLAPEDVESLTVGISGVSEQVQQDANENPAAIAAAAREKFTAVARLARDVDAVSLKLVENGCKELKHNDQTYYMFQPPADADATEAAKPLAIFLAQSKLVVLGSEAQVQAAIEAGGQQTRRTELDFVQPERQLLIVFVPKDKSALADTIPAGGGPDDPAGEMVQVATRNLQAFSLGINATSGIELNIQADCTDAKAAGDMKHLFDGLVVEARDSLSKSTNPVLAGFAAQAEAVLSSVQTSVDSSTLNASANVTDQTIASLEQAAPFLLLALMSGGLPGIGNGGPPPVEPTPTNLPTEAPDGIQVSGLVSWDDSISIGPNNKQLPPDLHLSIYLIGKQPQKAAAWGKVQLTSMTTDGGAQLKIKTGRFGQSDPTKSFLTVERSEFRDDHPQQGVQAVLRFPHPTKPVSEISKAAGTVSLQVPREQKVVTLKNVASLVGKPIEHPAVKEAEVELELTKEATSLSLKLVKGNPNSLVRVEPVDASGKPLEMVSTFRAGFGGEITYGVQLNDDIPADFGLNLILNVGLTQVDVPFDLSNIRVPYPPGSPGQPPVTTDGIPKGVTVAGKTAWSSVTETDQNGNELPPALDVQVTMLGTQAQKGIAWGFVKVMSLEGDNGVPLKVNVRRISFDGDSTKKFIAVKRNKYDKQHPDDGVTAVITLDHPAKTIREIAAIEGSVKLRAAKEQKSIIIAGFAAKAGKAVSHPDLKPTGLRFKLERENDDFKISLVAGDASSLFNVEVVDSAGKPLEGAETSLFSFGKELYYDIRSNGEKLPADAGLKLTINLSTEELEIPFRFEKLMVPDVPIR